MPLDIQPKDKPTERPNFSERHGTLYAQVANVLRQRIRSGLLAAGDQLPTLEELEREFGVARITLRQALSLLESEGLIWRQRGRGTFVSESGATEWFKLATSRDELIHSLEGAWSKLIKVDPENSEPLLEPGDGILAPSYRHMCRIHGRSDRPYALVDMHLDKATYRRAPRRFDKEMIIPVLDKMRGIEVADIRQTLTIGTADREVAEHLSVPFGAPIGIIRRVVIDGKGRAIYVGVVSYRGDMVKLDFSLGSKERSAAA